MGSLNILNDERLDAGWFRGRHVLVVGLGISGFWAANWLVKQGASVTVTDVKSKDQLDPGLYRQMIGLHVRLETGGHREISFTEADAIVISPGVPHDLPLLLTARERGIPVLGEMELASRVIEAPIVAVTGTNGKSTVTALLGAMLRDAGCNVFVGGNIGTPLMALAAGEEEADYAVIEVSSFQLDTAETFSPFISMVLNISPDHLDRYPSYDAYVRSKMKIFANQGRGQYVILNDDDPKLCSVRPSGAVTVLRYGKERKAGRHAYMEGGNVMAGRETPGVFRFSLDSVKLPGAHNVENFMGAVLAGLALGIEPHVIRKTLDQFRGLPHRLEKVAELNEVLFYNDSKATNVDAAIRAICSINRPLILIAGGRPKGADYGALARAAKGRVKKAILLGEARDLLMEAFEGVAPCHGAEDMEEAVSMAFAAARSGDAVLLSPACASFDMYISYEERGEAFKEAVEKLNHGP